MAAADVTKILRNPGRLSFGGTNIGITRNNRFEPRQILRPIYAEEFGANTDVIYCGERAMFFGTLRYADADAIGDLLPNSTATVWKFDADDVRAGTSLFGNAKALVFTPLNSPGTTVTFQNAIPTLAENAFLRFSWGVEYGLEIAWWAIPDGSGQVYSVDES